MIPYQQIKGTHTHHHHQQQQNNRNQQSLIIDIAQYQWSQFLNKKTQTNRMNAKTVSILLLHPRNTL